ncbi:3-phenylpropionate/trans-cinnamate dioxygenase ferredoxin component [uncultured bacterium]|nr:3-phenylpropionate/trans-cinnamate dioxygenase ferredoxin component [uncultured bacterium]
MTDWIDVMNESALGEGEHTVVDVDGEDVAIFKLDGHCYAIADVCTHDGGEIASGELEGDEIICPRHSARFCIKTGKVTAPPAYEDVACFPVRIEQGIIQVRDDRWD